MNKFLITFLFLIPLFASAQSNDTSKYTPAWAYGYQWPRGKWDSTMIIPRGDTVTNPLGAWRDKGSLKYRNADSSLYFHNGVKWVSITKGGTGSLVKYSDSISVYATPTQVLQLIADNIPGWQRVTDIDNTTTNDVILRNAFYRLRWPGWTMDDYKQFSIGRNNDTTELMNQYLGSYNMAVKIGTTTFSGQQHLDASSRFTMWQPIIPFITNSAFSVLTGDFYRDLGYAQDSSISGTQVVRNVISHNQQYLRPGATAVKGTVLQATLVNDMPRTTPWKILNVFEKNPGVDSTDWFTVYGGGKITAKNIPLATTADYINVMHNDTLKKFPMSTFGNFANTDLTLTGDRHHNAALHSLAIDSLSDISFDAYGRGLNGGAAIRTHSAGGDTTVYISQIFGASNVAIGAGVSSTGFFGDVRVEPDYRATIDVGNSSSQSTLSVSPTSIILNSANINIPSLTTGYSQYVMADGYGNLIPSGVFATTASVPDLTALAALVTSATAINVEDTLTGDLFLKQARNGRVDYPGMIIACPGTSDSVYSRFLSDPTEVKLTFFGAKHYDPTNPSTKVSCHTAANLATGWFPNRNGTVDINGVFYTNQPIVYGEGTVFQGNNTLFPLQTNPDTIRYRSQSAIWFDSTNCFEPDMGVVSYRNQKPSWDKIGIFFAGPLTNTYFGILFKNNTNSTASLKNVGLASNTDCYIYGAHVGVGNNDYSNLSSDSYVWRGGQISFTDTAIVMGKSGNYVIELDSYGNRVGVKTNGNNNKVLNSTFEYGYLGNSADTSSIGIIHNSTKDEIAGNICNFMGRFIRHTVNASRSFVHDNGYLQTNNTTITLDSAANLIEFYGNNYVTTTQNPMAGKYFIYGYKAADIKIHDEQMTSSSGSLTIAGTFDTCTGLILSNPHTKGLQSPDNKNFVFNGCTFSSQTEFQNKIIQGNIAIVNGNTTNIVAGGYLSFALDNPTIPTELINTANTAGGAAFYRSTTKYEGTLSSKSGLSAGSILLRDGYKLYTSSGTTTGERLIIGAATTEATTTSAQGTKFYVATTPPGTTGATAGFNVNGNTSFFGDSLTVGRARVEAKANSTTVPSFAFGRNGALTSTPAVGYFEGINGGFYYTDSAGGVTTRRQGVTVDATQTLSNKTLDITNVIQNTAYSFNANNTNATGNQTAQNFRNQSSQILDTTTFTWTGTTPPNTVTGRTYSWQQVGNMVTVRINILYTVAGVSLTQLLIALPSDMPAPLQPSNYTAASDVISEGVGHLNASKAIQTATSAAGIRRNAAGTGFEFYIQNGSAVSATSARATITYFTN